PAAGSCHPAVHQKITAQVELSAAVAASGGTRVEYDEEPDLGEYDRAVGLAGGGGGHAALGA
ncbi:hypothetical protein DW781_10895, partial [Olsenella sp. AM30-3LB]|uniref:hypothetical protein n=1 Tax=Olsenella sp. AM30-3LB TaxID=2292359 RepID=UPI000FEED628